MNNQKLQILQTTQHESVQKQTHLFFNTCFDKNLVKDLVSWFLKNYGEKNTIDFLENLKTKGFYHATKAGISLGIEDLSIPTDKIALLKQTRDDLKTMEQKNHQGSITNVEKSQYLIDKWNQTSDALRQSAISNFRKQNPLNPVYMMAFSGARGNISQVRQLVAMRGLMADPQGSILEFPIQSNFREGLTITEYLISCYGARKGLVDTALRTATSGYLTRRLVDAAQHAVITLRDCGTKKFITIHGPNLENRLIGRVLAKEYCSFSKNTILSIKEAQKIALQYTHIAVRSPLTCHAIGTICQLCYGWNLASGKLVQIGDAVGVMAAQSIGEPGTQLTMRTFHTGGVGVFSGEVLKPIRAPFTGKLIFPKPLCGHFVRTPYGEIVYMVKYLLTEPTSTLFLIQSLEDKSQKFSICQSEFPPGSLLLLKNGEYVESNQLIGQACHLKLSKQTLPESSHPVYAPLSGQTFFDLMKLTVEQKIIIDENNFWKEIPPPITRMREIGTFWILSSSNFREPYLKKCFIQQGDLVSKKTIFFNYHFYPIFKSQLKRLSHNLVFGSTIFQLSFYKSDYLKNCYRLHFDNKNSYVIYFKRSNISSSFIWYPSNKRNLSQISKKNKNLSTWYFEANNFYRKDFDCPLFQHYPKGLFFYFFESFINFLIFTSKILPFNPYKKILINKKDFTFSDFKILPNKFLIRFFAKGFSYSQQTLSKKNWIYIPPSKIDFTNLKKETEFVLNGEDFQSITIPKQNLLIRRISFSLINKEKNSFQSDPIFPSRNWYNLENFFSQDSFNFDKNKVFTHKCVKKSKSFLKKKLFWYRPNLSKYTRFYSNFFRIDPHYKTIRSGLIVTHLSEYSYSPKKTLHREAKSFFQPESIKIVTNPLFSKQNRTLTKLKPIKSYYKIQRCSQVGWSENFQPLQIIMNFKNSLIVNKHYYYGQNPNSLSSNLNLFTYREGDFKGAQNFKYRTFQNNFLLPEFSFTHGIRRNTCSGEFHYRNYKNYSTQFTILRYHDQQTFTGSKTLPIQQLKIPKIGKLLRSGQNISNKVAFTGSGRIIRKTPACVTIRKGIPILASASGILHVIHNELITQNQLIITLKSKQLQTEDIVQGIPKIEQLFEARESQTKEISIYTILQNSFIEEVRKIKYKDWSLAVDKTFLKIQKFLVGNIIDAYSNQGVKISEKHVEVIVRQMTSRVRIIESGDTGLLPGEIVHYTWILKFNSYMNSLNLRQARYEPLVLGISKSVLQSESFLLAASFQEVSRVLIKSALAKKKDFLRGLHENVIVGQLIPSGTGLLSQRTNLSVKKYG